MVITQSHCVMHCFVFFAVHLVSSHYYFTDFQQSAEVRHFDAFHKYWKHKPIKAVKNNVLCCSSRVFFGCLFSLLLFCPRWLINYAKIIVWLKLLYQTCGQCPWCHNFLNYFKIITKFVSVRLRDLVWDCLSLSCELSEYHLLHFVRSGFSCHHQQVKYKTSAQCLCLVVTCYSSL